MKYLSLTSTIQCACGATLDFGSASNSLLIDNIPVLTLNTLLKARILPGTCALEGVKGAKACTGVQRVLTGEAEGLVTEDGAPVLSSVQVLLDGSPPGLAMASPPDSLLVFSPLLTPPSRREPASTDNSEEEPLTSEAFKLSIEWSVDDLRIENEPFLVVVVQEVKKCPIRAHRVIYPQACTRKTVVFPELSSDLPAWVLCVKRPGKTTLTDVELEGASGTFVAVPRSSKDLVREESKKHWKWTYMEMLREIKGKKPSWRVLAAANFLPPDDKKLPKWSVVRVPHLLRSGELATVRASYPKLLEVQKICDSLEGFSKQKIREDLPLTVDGFVGESTARFSLASAAEQAMRWYSDNPPTVFQQNELFGLPSHESRRRSEVFLRGFETIRGDLLQRIQSHFTSLDEAVNLSEDELATIRGKTPQHLSNYRELDEILKSRLEDFEEIVCNSLSSEVERLSQQTLSIQGELLKLASLLKNDNNLFDDLHSSRLLLGLKPGEDGQSTSTVFGKCVGLLHATLDSLRANDRRLHNLLPPLLIYLKSALWIGELEKRRIPVLSSADRKRLLDSFKRARERSNKAREQSLSILKRSVLTISVLSYLLSESEKDSEKRIRDWLQRGVFSAQFVELGALFTFDRGKALLLSTVRVLLRRYPQKTVAPLGRLLDILKAVQKSNDKINYLGQISKAGRFADLLLMAYDAVFSEKESDRALHTISLLLLLVSAKLSFPFTMLVGLSLYVRCELEERDNRLEVMKLLGQTEFGKFNIKSDKWSDLGNTDEAYLCYSPPNYSPRRRSDELLALLALQRWTLGYYKVLSSRYPSTPSFGFKILLGENRFYHSRASIQVGERLIDINVIQEKDKVTLVLELDPKSSSDGDSDLVQETLGLSSNQPPEQPQTAPPSTYHFDITTDTEGVLLISSLKPCGSRTYEIRRDETPRRWRTLIVVFGEKTGLTPGDSSPVISLPGFSVDLRKLTPRPGTSFVGRSTGRKYTTLDPETLRFSVDSASGFHTPKY